MQQQCMAATAATAATEDAIKTHLYVPNLTKVSILQLY